MTAKPVELRSGQRDANEPGSHGLDPADLDPPKARWLAPDAGRIRRSVGVSLIGASLPPRGRGEDDGRVDHRTSRGAGAGRRRDGALLLLTGCDPARPDDGTWWFTPAAAATPARRTRTRPGGSCARRPDWRSPTSARSCSAASPTSTSKACATASASRSSRYARARFAIDDAGWSDVERRSRAGAPLVDARRTRADRRDVPSRSSCRRSSATCSKPGPERGAERYGAIGGTGCGGGGPTYSALGRMSRLSAACSRMCAHHPITRLEANVGVNRSRGMPQRSMTMPA